MLGESLGRASSAWTASSSPRCGAAHAGSRRTGGLPPPVSSRTWTRCASSRCSRALARAVRKHAPSTLGDAMVARTAVAMGAGIRRLFEASCSSGCAGEVSAGVESWLEFRARVRQRSRWCGPKRAGSANAAFTSAGPFAFACSSPGRGREQLSLAFRSAIRRFRVRVLRRAFSLAPSTSAASSGRGAGTVR